MGTADELDVLVFLSRDRTRYWSPQTVAAETRLPNARVSMALEVLASRNLLDVRIAEAVLYRLDPSSSECRFAVERTLEAAWRARSAVVELLTA